MLWIIFLNFFLGKVLSNSKPLNRTELIVRTFYTNL